MILKKIYKECEKFCTRIESIARELKRFTVIATKVLFVCLGNICRSPTAHGVFQTKVTKAGLERHIIIDSCGTGDWHIGHAPDSRSSEKALEAGYDLSDLRARQITASDYFDFDYIFAMDNSNLNDIHSVFAQNSSAENKPVIELFLKYSLFTQEQKINSDILSLAKSCNFEVPDPYYGGADGFTTVLHLIEAASDALINQLKPGSPASRRSL